MIRRFLGRKRQILGAALLVLAILISVFLVRPGQANASQILAKSENSSLSSTDPSEVLYDQSTLYERVNPLRVEPPDPYHLPAAPIISDTTIVDNWARGGGLSESRSTGRDGNSQRIVFDLVRDGQANVFGLYTLQQGFAVIGPLDQSGPTSGDTPVPSAAPEHDAKVVGTTTSAWGKPAWIIQASAPAPEEAANQDTDLLPYEKPYLSDLIVTGLEYTWIVDQDSNRLVKQEIQAETSSGMVSIYRRENDPIQVLKISDLPADWLNFPLEKVPVVNGNSPVVPDIAEISIDEAVKNADFTIFLPDPALSNLPAPQLRMKLPDNADPIEQDTWPFDIQTVYAHGLALQAITVVGPADSSQVLVIVQGRATTLVPLMRETLPLWAESHEVTISIEGQIVPGWVASGGVLSTPPQQVLLMTEVDDTFLFVIGQDYTDQALLDVVQTFTAMK